jgi:excisionase family DNA binding protein
VVLVNGKLMNSSLEQSSMSAVQLPRFLRVEEVANLLRCKKRTIYDMVEQERIPCRRAGGRLLFDLDEIINWTKVKS